MDGKTIKCVSIAEKPSCFGIEFHNKGYEFFGLNYVYIPLKVTSNNLESTIQLVRENFKGCGVSMPYKIEVIKYLDELDESAEKVGAVNTILNNGRLKGFNTDYYGARSALKNTLEIEGKDILMIGAGGAARAIGHAVKDLDGRLWITNRTEARANELAYILRAKTIQWQERNSFNAYLLINATSIGFNNINESPLLNESISNYEAVMDIVLTSDAQKTRLIREAESKMKIVIPGRTMTIYQAAKQFYIYTEKKLPEEFLNKFI